MATSEGRYLIEVDGITAVESTEVSGVNKTHQEFELFISNRPNPILGRGHYKCEKITVKHGHALNSAGEEFFAWFDGYINGTNVEKRNARLIILEEDSDTIAAIYELEECVPIMFGPDTHTAGGNNASYFRFEFRPTNMKLQ